MRPASKKMKADFARRCRELDKKKTTLICEKCGDAFTGPKWHSYCFECVGEILGAMPVPPREPIQ